MKNSKVDIWPLNIVYVSLMLIVGIFILGLIILPFGLLINNQPLKLFDIIPLNTGELQFIITLPIGILGCYFYMKLVLWKVSFTETHIIVPKIAEVQEKRVQVACEKILTCETAMEGFYYFFVFNCEDGRTRKMFITRFSFKQLERILKLIQEKGGLQGQDIDVIINPLRIKKKSKNFKI